MARPQAAPHNMPRSRPPRSRVQPSATSAVACVATASGMGTSFMLWNTSGPWSSATAPAATPAVVERKKNRPAGTSSAMAVEVKAICIRMAHQARSAGATAR